MIERCMKAAFTTALLFVMQQGAFATIPIEHWTQESGAQVYLVQSPAISMVDVQIDWDAGARRDPAGATGLASAMADSLSSGVLATPGVAAMDENQLGQAWADLGAMFGASAGNDRLSVTLRSLSYPDLLERAAKLASRQIGQPAFPDDVWLRDKTRMVASLKESMTKAHVVAGKAFSTAVYGNHPYGAQVTEESLMAISVDAMKRLHDQYILACNAKVSVVGAVDREQADRLVKTMLSKLPQGGCRQLPEIPEVEPLKEAREIRIAFASAQTQILVGQPGIRRASSDYFALLVGNQILGGGGFSSRLMSELREKRGLTYGVSSGFMFGLHAGAFMMSMQTRPDQSEEALHVLRQVLAEFVSVGPTEEELRAAKDNLIGGLALRLDSNRKLVDNVSNIVWNNLPLDYLQTWSDQIEKISTKDIREAFARTLQPQKMVTVVLGGQ